MLVYTALVLVEPLRQPIMVSEGESDADTGSGEASRLQMAMYRSH